MDPYPTGVDVDADYKLIQAARTIRYSRQYFKMIA
jgi:hypothetical protein